MTRSGNATRGDEGRGSIPDAKFLPGAVSKIRRDSAIVVRLAAERMEDLADIINVAIEELIRDIVDQYTVVIVTHNMQQATRVSDFTGFMTIERAGEPGRLVEFGTTDQIFGAPKLPATEAYVSGRVG